MVDPGFLFGGGRVAAGLLKRWAESSGTLDGLLELLDKQFGDETGLSLTQLQTWKNDEAFQEALFVLDTTGDWEAARPARLISIGIHWWLCFKRSP